MATCGFEGNSDMYGMGIRIGYYLQWYGGILAAWIAPNESSSLRIANSLFVTATFLALVIQTVQDHGESATSIVETYIILFLAFGSYLVLVPIFLWRIFTGCNPYWDPTRFPRVNPGRVYNFLNILLLLAVLSFQLWYWFYEIPKLNDDPCVRYGFFFWRWTLRHPGFRGFNLLVCSFLLICCVTIVAFNIISIIKRRRKKPEGIKLKGYRSLDGNTVQRAHIMQYLDSVSQFIVATTVVTGVELTIRWNSIQGVHEISSAGQTIPLILGIGAVVIVVYVWKFKGDAEAALPEQQTTANQYSQNPTWNQEAPAAAHEPAGVTMEPVEPDTWWTNLPAAARNDIQLDSNVNYYP